MGKCAVATCINVNDRKSRRTDIKFYRFPGDLKLRKQWIILCGRKKDFATEHAVVCSNHFPEDKRHTLQCRLLGTLGNIRRKTTCVCRIPEGEVPTLELPDSKNKSKLAVKLAEKLEAQKEKARKELVEELLRSSSYSSVPKVTPQPVHIVQQVQPAQEDQPAEFVIHYRPVSMPSTSQIIAGPSNVRKHKATRTIRGDTAVKKARTTQFILPKPPAESNINKPVMLAVMPNLEVEATSDSESMNLPSQDIAMISMDCKLDITEHNLSDTETVSDFDSKAVEEDESVVLPVDIKDEPMEVFSESEVEADERDVGSPIDMIDLPGLPGYPARLDDLCRICALPGEEMTYIFSDDGRHAQLKHKINTCMPITVSEEDSLPLLVCKVCVLRLELSYKLAATCQKSDIKLKRLQKKIAQQGPGEHTGLTALDFCAVEVAGNGNDFTIPKQSKRNKSPLKYKATKKSKTNTVSTLAQPVKLVQKIASNKLPVLCKICNTLLCTTNDTVHHYLKLHDKSACEFCFEYFDNNQGLVEHLNSTHIHNCKFCTFKIIGLGENILKNHISNVHLKGSTIKTKVVTTKKVVKPFVVKRGPEKSGIITCKICTLLYSSKIALKKHYENVHKKYLCISCFTDFKTKDELDHHVTENFHDIICKFCNREFSSNRGLQNHTSLVHKDALGLENDDNDYDCNDCNSVFVSQRNLRRHYLKVHSKYACCICEVIVKTKEEYDEHIKEKNHYTCESCEVDFNTEDALKLHISTHAIGSDFKCQTCDKTFTSRTGLKNHIKHLHLNIPYKYPCSLCEKRFKSPKKLHQHMKRHNNEKNVKCDICEKRFYDSEALKIHSHVHITERKYVCDQCGAKFAHQRNLSAHITGVHTTKWIFTCDECNYVSQCEDDIGIHCRQHDNNIMYTRTSPYYCAECNKYFANKLYWLTHTRNHKLVKDKKGKPREKKFECNQCQKRFLSKFLLKKHFGTHLEIKPFNCTICSRGFMEDKDLDIHMRLHTNFKPFICNICEKSFHKKTNLTVHRRNVHQTVKKIQCTSCDKMFKRKQQLVVHLRTHTKEKPYVCEVCGQAFSQRGDMVRHRQRHDGIMTVRKPK